MRPAPSLRIIFVSPALRIPGLLQTPFLSKIDCPPRVRSELEEHLNNGESVTAKITWLASGDDDDKVSGADRRGNAKTRFVNCVPLLDADENVGVWIVVMVDEAKVTGGLAPGNRSTQRSQLENYDLASTPDHTSNFGTQGQPSSTSNTDAPPTDATSPLSRNPMTPTKQTNGSSSHQSNSRPSSSYIPQRQSSQQHRRFQSTNGDSNSMYHDSIREGVSTPNWSTMGKPWSLKEQERHKQTKRGTLSRQETEEIPRRSEDVGTV